MNIFTSPSGIQLIISASPNVEITSVGLGDLLTPDDASTLQEDLNKLGQWENEWCMKFHPDKCNVLRVTNKTKKTEANYHLHGHTLELVTSAKYLGLTITNKLQWDQHINNITAKANKTLGFLSSGGTWKFHQTGLKNKPTKRLFARWLNMPVLFGILIRKQK